MPFSLRLALLLAAVLAAACSDRGAPAGPVGERAALYDAELLYAEYRADPAAADARYRGRPILVTGRMQRVVERPDGGVDMELKAEDADHPIVARLLPDQQCQGGQRCAAADSVRSMLRGAKVYVRCTAAAPANGLPALQDCVLVASPEAAARPAH